MFGTNNRLRSDIPEFLYSDDSLNELRMDLGESMWLKLHSEHNN